MSPLVPKLVYLTRRKRAFARNDWTARWREHGKLGMAQPRWHNVARYVHCDLLEPPPGQSRWLGDYDGVGLIWHHSLVHRDAHFSDQSSQATMERDEAETFAEPISRHCVSVAEEILMPPQAGADFHLFCFAWDDGHIAAPTGALGHVRSQPLAGPDGTAWGLDCQQIAEFWFADFADALTAGEALAASGRTLVIGRDCELFRIPD